MSWCSVPANPSYYHAPESRKASAGRSCCVHRSRRGYSWDPRRLRGGRCWPRTASMAAGSSASPSCDPRRLRRASAGRASPHRCRPGCWWLRSSPTPEGHSTGLEVGPVKACARGRCDPRRAGRPGAGCWSPGSTGTSGTSGTSGEVAILTDPPRAGAGRRAAVLGQVHVGVAILADPGGPVLVAGHDTV